MNGMGGAYIFDFRKIDWSVKHQLSTKHSNLLIFLFQVGLICVWLYRTSISTVFCLKLTVPYTHRPNCKWLCWSHPHVRPHIAFHALADWGAVMQDGATPHTARISHAFLTNATIGALLWSTKSPDISTIENAWSVILRRINSMDPLLRNAAELRAACTVNGWTSHWRAYDDYWSALHTEFAPSSKLKVDMVIIIQYCNNGFFKVIIVCMWNLYNACVLSIR